MRRPKVEFQETPNPSAGKFTVDRVLLEGRRGMTLVPGDDAAAAPFLQPLLLDPDVASVFVVADFVTVTKRDRARWAELAPRLTALLREALPR